MKKYVLLNPGPVNITESVRKALVGEDICHREEEFSHLLQEIRRKILKIYNLDSKRYTTVILTSSGTGAVEASICSCVPEDKILFVISNGIYGERMIQIANAYKIPVKSVIYKWGEKINLSEIEDILKSDKDSKIYAIAIVHHETTTGLLNPLDKVGTLAKKYNKILIVDAVSSFGGEEINFDNWGIDVVSSTANKCIHSVPGCAFVILKNSLIDAMKDISPRNIYLNLLTYHNLQEKGIPPFTPAIQVMYAFNQALDEFLEEGIEGRVKRYKKLSLLARKKAKEIGLKMLLDEKDYSNTLTSFYLPDNISYEFLHDELKKRGFIIYAGQAGLKNKIFRIANMGNIKEEDIERLFENIYEIINKK